MFDVGSGGVSDDEYVVGIPLCTPPISSPLESLFYFVFADMVLCWCKCECVFKIFVLSVGTHSHR